MFQMFCIISHQDILTWIIHIRLEEKWWKTSEPWDMLVLCGYWWTVLFERFAFSLNKREGRRENGILFQTTFSQIPNGCFVIILARSYLLRGIFSSGCNKLLIQARALDFGSVWTIWNMEGVCWILQRYHNLSSAIPLSFVSFCLPRLRKTLVWEGTPLPSPSL